MDASSPGLWTDSVAGELNTTVKIAFTTTNKGATVGYLSYEKPTKDGPEPATASAAAATCRLESLSLNFTKVSWSFTGTDPAVSGTPVVQGYDLTTRQRPPDSGAKPVIATPAKAGGSNPHPVGALRWGLLRRFAASALKSLIMWGISASA